MTRADGLSSAKGTHEGQREGPRASWGGAPRRTPPRKLYVENFMHGRSESNTSLDQLMPACRGKVVYVSGSFRNEQAMQQLKQSALREIASRVIFPKDLIDLGKTFPHHYPWEAREQAIGLLAAADVVLVILPRYGVDTSWQVGYASALNKPLLGWVTAPTGNEVENAPIWDHWMHGWKEKLTTTRLSEVAAVIRGFFDAGLLATKS